MIHPSVSGKVRSKKGRLSQCMEGVSSVDWRVFPSGHLDQCIQSAKTQALEWSGTG